MNGVRRTRPVEALAMIVLLVAGCRSLSERSFTRKDAESDASVQRRQSSGYTIVGEMAGQLASCLVNGHTIANHEQ